MITMNMLRERIDAANAWQDIADILGLDSSPETLADSANDEVIYRAFVEGSIKSKKLSNKLHNYPFPDITNLGRYSDPSMEYHLGGGLNTAIGITQKAEKYKHPFESASNVFDFGCGTSRILRYMIEFLSGPQYYGSEVFDENVEWGKCAFPEVIYIHQNNFPPLDIQDSTFDIIYAYSIFTHFEEKIHLQWLSELHRTLRKGGLLILTVHGEPILRRCEEDEDVRKPMYVCNQDYEELCDKFYKYGYVYYSCYDQKQLLNGGLDSDVFGIAYISKEYIRGKWTDKFQILEHDEGAISNWQDYVVMRKL